MNLGRLFFPNTRKEIIIENVSLQKDRAGNPSIKTAITMPLDDGKLVGMPNFFGEHYLELQKAMCLAGSVKYPNLQLEEMTVYAHTGPETTKPAQTFICPVINGFQMVRGDLPKANGEEALAPVWLEFVMYINGSLEHWSWIFRHFRPASIYGLFLSTQSDIEDPKPADPQMTLAVAKTKEEIEAERREALKPEHDPEWARA